MTRFVKLGNNGISFTNTVIMLNSEQGCHGFRWAGTNDTSFVVPCSSAPSVVQYTSTYYPSETRRFHAGNAH